MFSLVKVAELSIPAKNESIFSSPQLSPIKNSPAKALFAAPKNRKNQRKKRQNE
jgi:hypothetical protein